LFPFNFILGGNSVNGINQSNSVIGIKLLKAQSDPIKRRPLYIKTKKTKQKKEKMTVTKTNDVDREKKIQNSMTCNK